MIKVLHIMAGADAGGISTVVLNYYSHIDREQFQFDIAVTTDQVGKNAEEFKMLGARIYRIPLKSTGIKKYETAVRDMLEENQYNAIHVHENETSYVALRVAKKMGIPCRIAHSHTSLPCNGLKSEIRRMAGIILNRRYATKLIGCGKLAGIRVFGQSGMKCAKGMVLPNAIETEKFAYSEAVRNSVRAELRLEGKYVVGMVGRISPEKNTLYALELFTELKKKKQDVALIIAGNGPDEEQLVRKIDEYGLEQDVIYLGRRNDANRLYQAFDLFWLPSIHEGFPVAAVEAMASGLPVIVSDTITRELDIDDQICYLPIEDQSKWVEVSVQCLDMGRRERTDELKAHDLEIIETVKKLEYVYYSQT